eukprot:15326614-Ditylum_brightwellii.AAC.2
MQKTPKSLICTCLTTARPFKELWQQRCPNTEDSEPNQDGNTTSKQTMCINAPTETNLQQNYQMQKLNKAYNAAVFTSIVYN